MWQQHMAEVAYFLKQLAFMLFLLYSPSLANKGETGSQQDGGGLNCGTVILVMSLVNCC